MRRRDAPRRNLSRRDPMYFRHFTRVLSLRWTPTLRSLDRSAVYLPSTPVYGERLLIIVWHASTEEERERVREKEREREREERGLLTLLTINRRRNNNARVNGGKESGIFFENVEIFITRILASFNEWSNWFRRRIRNRSSTLEVGKFR